MTSTRNIVRPAAERAYLRHRIWGVVEKGPTVKTISMKKLEVMEKSERGRLSSEQCDCVCTPSPPERDPPALTSRYSKAKEVTV